MLGSLTIAEPAIAPLDNPLVALATMPLGDRMGATAGQAVMTAFAVVAEYARLLVWPLRLSPDYSFNQIPIVATVLDARFIVGIALVVAYVGGAIGLRRRSPLAAFGLIFLAVTFFLVSNLVIRIGTICAERLIYLPSAGLFIAAGLAFDRLTGAAPVRRRAGLAVLAVLVTAAGARTWARNRDWHDESSLWTAAVRVAPASARVQSEYGRILLTRAQAEAEAGRTDDAERLYAGAGEHFDAAVRIYPSYSLPLDGLAMIASLHGRFDEANALYARATQAWPGNYASLTNWASLVWDQARQIGSRAMTLRQEGKIAESDVLVRQADQGFQQAVEKITGQRQWRRPIPRHISFAP